jgi:hypothetical protein
MMHVEERRNPMTDTTTRHGDRPEDQDGIAYYEYIGSAEGLRAEEAGTYSEYDVEAFDEMNREAWMMPDLAAGPVERGDASEAEGRHIFWQVIEADARATERPWS